MNIFRELVMKIVLLFYLCILLIVVFLCKKNKLLIILLLIFRSIILHVAFPRLKINGYNRRSFGYGYSNWILDYRIEDIRRLKEKVFGWSDRSKRHRIWARIVLLI